MVVATFARATIQRLRPQLIPDSHGNSVPDWSLPADAVWIGGCSVQPAATQENLANRDTVLDEFTVYAPRFADIGPLDRIQWQGGDYEVVGQPNAWDSPTGAVSHIQFNMRRWKG